MSLKISTEMSIELLESKRKEDVDLLYFLGCLPGGFKTVEALQSMYPHQHDLYDSIKSMKDLSFFEVGAEKTMLSPHVIDYVNKNIEPSTKTQFMIIVGNYYSELLQKNY